MSIDQALEELAIGKDFNGDPEKLDFIHRKLGQTDVYFVRNKTDHSISEACEFRIKNGEAEFWDPVTAKQYRIRDAKSIHGKTKVNLQLAPYESCFIVFNAGNRHLPEYNRPPGDLTTEIDGPWTLSFPENWGAPGSTELNELISWTEHDNKGIHYFSGTASYTNRFNIPEEWLDQNSIINLDLGEVLDVAEVFVNGKSAGILWTSPFSIDIQDYVKPGKNHLEIKITNMWINRLTGDMDLPAGEKFCNTNRPPIMRARSPIDDETYRVQPSGLLGPVTLTETTGNANLRNEFRPK